MKDWAIYFFGSFFSHLRAREGCNRSLMNGVLGFCLAVAVLVGLMNAGYRLAVPAALQEADAFLSYAEGVFSGLDLKVEAGTLKGDAYVQQKSENGLLVVDLRDLVRLYDDFSVAATDSSGKTVSYEAYLALSDSQRENYSLQVEFSGQVRDIGAAANQEAWLTFLQERAEQDADVKTRLEALKPDSEDYQEQVYLLYVSVYYNGVKLSDGYGQAPTLQGYYADLAQKNADAQAILLFCRWCSVSFESEGRTMALMGYYTDMDGYTTAEGADSFIRRTFASSRELTVLMYCTNLFRAVPLMLVIWLALALILMAVCRSRQLYCGYHFLGALQIIGSFLVISALFGGMVSFWAAFVMSQEGAYSLGLISFYAALVVRSGVHIVLELLGVYPDEEYSLAEE